MSSINGIGSSNPIREIAATASASRPASAQATTPNRAADRLELSGASHLLKALKTGDIRAEKVAAIRKEIEAGTYENDQKLNVAIDRLIDDLEL